MKKNIVVAVLLVALGAGGALAYLRITRGSSCASATSCGDFCARHQIAEKDCPWCSPSLVTGNGPCPEHGVSKALCTKCNPDLIAGFKAENDWCAGHALPESQCALCKGGDLPPGEAPRPKR